MFSVFSHGCIEGCYCPPGYYENDDEECVKKEDCGCYHEGKMYKSGEQRKEKCNTW